MIGQGLGEPAVDAESATPVTVLLAKGDHRGVDCKAVQQRLEDGIADVVQLQLGHRLAVHHGRAHLAGDLVDARVLGQVPQELGLALVETLDASGREHDAAHHLGTDIDTRARVIVDRQAEHVEDQILDGAACLVQRRLLHRTARQDMFAKALYAVRRLPLLHLFAAAIARRVRRRMPAVAVGERVQQHWAASCQQGDAGALESVDHRERVVAVDLLRVHLLGVHSGAEAGNGLHACGLALRLAAHAVEVVHAVEHDRQPATDGRVPQLAVLVHGRESDTLPHRATAEGTVADVGHHDAGPAIDALEQGRSRRDRARASDDGVVGVDPESGEESVHGAAETAIESGLAREHLAVGAVDEEAFRELADGDAVRLLHRAEDRAVAVGAHHVLQVVITQPADGRQPLGEDLAVAAV